VILGFEQANRYTVLDQDGSVVALMAEDRGSIGKEVGRQLLRTRRNFTATVFSPDGGCQPSQLLSTSPICILLMPPVLYAGTESA